MKKIERQKAKSEKLKSPVGVVSDKGNISLFFKAEQFGKVGLYLSKGKTGVRFAGLKTKIQLLSSLGKPETFEEKENISVSPIDQGYFMSFVKKDNKKDQLIGAVSKDMKKFTIAGKISSVDKKGILVPHYKHADNYVMYLGQGSIYTAVSKNFKKWDVSEVSCLKPRSKFFDHSQISVLMVSLVEDGILVVYDASFVKNGRQTLQIGAALFCVTDPNNIIWRSESPLWQEERPVGSELITSMGAAFYKAKIYLYFMSQAKKMMRICINQPFPSIKEKATIIKLTKFHKNPIIVPDDMGDWRSEGTFNPAALYADGRVHLLYRAIGKSGLSCFGYASSADGFHFDVNHDEPAYVPRERFEGIHTKPRQVTDLFKSGCGWGGCEDPKLTEIEDTIYLTYVAYTGYSEPRVALSSIKREDFLKHNWKKWKKPKLISRPGEVNKSGCILPEKVEGKYVIFHRVFPHILIDKRNDLEFDDGTWLEAKHMIKTRPHLWDSRKLSVGATPIKTNEGWLVIYHAVDDRDDTKYKIGAMILDTKDPSKVLYRTTKPILEPDEHYENEGKSGVAYPCGAVVIGNELIVYYGGGDRVVCCATAHLEKFVEDVKKDKEVSTVLKEVPVS
ncbi:MAG: hypothetical protein PHQ52_03655 [Candidatus Omnitrophica bacterium]|nr:hypothetical protein [Candidatus Omnitrophota bacterium]